MPLACPKAPGARAPFLPDFAPPNTGRGEPFMESILPLRESNLGIEEKPEPMPEEKPGLPPEAPEPNLLLKPPMLENLLEPPPSWLVSEPPMLPPCSLPIISWAMPPAWSAPGCALGSAAWPSSGALALEVSPSMATAPLLVSLNMSSEDPPLAAWLRRMAGT